MKRSLAAFLLIGYACAALAQQKAPPKPKLILAVVIDQFRYDYLLRFNADYKYGFRKVLDSGAVFDDAHHIHFPTVTAVGHSTFLTGATPSLSGIVGNEWYDRETHKTVTSVSDPSTELVGASAGASGSSPQKLLVSTVGDQIKMSGEKIKVIGVSIKDRSAILPAGHMADAAYWFDSRSHNWVTSTYYEKSLPEWVNAVNQTHPESRAAGQKWLPLDAKPGAAPFCMMGAAGGNIPACRSLEASPWGNEMIEEMAEKALVAENMGHHDGTDVLTVSFSSNDYVGHAVGPDSPQVRDISIRTDRLLGKLLDAVDRAVGLNNVVFVMTADHGVAPVPEVNTARRMPGGRLSNSGLAPEIQQALTDKFGPGKWVIASTGTTPYLNHELIAEHKLDLGTVEEVAAEAVRKNPHVFRVYTAEQLRKGEVRDDLVSGAVSKGYYRQRSGDLFIIPDEYYMYDAAGTTHGTPFNYDSHVPIVFMGPGIRAGHYYRRVAVNDIAPTLTAISRVEQPSGSVGRVLEEMWN